MTDLELHNLSLKAREIWDNGTQDKPGWRDEYDKLADQISKEIYTRLGIEEYSNISVGAEEYLWNHKEINMEELCLCCTGLCWAYFKNKPEQVIIKHLKEYFAKEYSGYGCIESCLIDILWEKMYGEIYDNNKYHPVRFYVEYGIKPDLETFEQIDGAEIGGWCEVWDNDPKALYDKYMSISNTIEIQHPSRKETMQTLQEQQTAEQMTIFDLMKGGE